MNNIAEFLTVLKIEFLLAAVYVLILLVCNLDCFLDDYCCVWIRICERALYVLLSALDESEEIAFRLVVHDVCYCVTCMNV